MAMVRKSTIAWMLCALLVTALGTSRQYSRQWPLGFMAFKVMAICLKLSAFLRALSLLMEAISLADIAIWGLSAASE